jgi:2Fe-2S ferredoxin
MEVITQAGIADIFGVCGGSCSCATCHVFVDEISEDGAALLSPISGYEDSLLEASSQRKVSSRLSCQIRAQGARYIRVTMAPEE